MIQLYSHITVTLRSKVHNNPKNPVRRPGRIFIHCCNIVRIFLNLNSFSTFELASQVSAHRVSHNTSPTSSYKLPLIFHKIVIYYLEVIL